MDPTTIAVAAVVAAFIFSRKSGDAAQGGSGAAASNASGGTTTSQPGSAVPCAPGLVRGQDGKCRKSVKVKPGDTPPAGSISDTPPDVIDRDDAWIGPGCRDMVYGKDFFRQTMLPAVLEYVDAGYGFAPEFYTPGEAFDAGNLASISSIAVIAGMLGSYRPECAEILNAWNLDNLPSQNEINRFRDKYNAAREDFMADKITQAQFDAVKNSDPLIVYWNKRIQFLKSGRSFGSKARDLMLAILAAIADRGYQNMNSGNLELAVVYPYPSRFTPKPEDFA